MRSLLNDVAAFHLATGTPVLDTPTVPPHDRMMLRMRLLHEEYNEFLHANGTGDLVEVADALADMIYICVGTALEYGIPLDKVWDEVQRTNMAKVDPVTGLVKRRPDGKIMKPEGWTGPDIAGVLGPIMTQADVAAKRAAIAAAMDMLKDAGTSALDAIAKTQTEQS